ncbi:type I restriction endonuclease [Salinarimonas rosea]|uniref:type I restriction endonuclease n=1 Tax=Salinarimonas rosea TaxID=552063 RepID=UPI00041CE64E|nr:type I restriction endonuclease [Salinarimonas rosea]
MNEIESTIERLRARIKDLRERRVARPTEADTIRVLITPLLRALGWDIDDLDEVRNEYRHNPSDNPVDYALFLNRTPVLFVEAKALGEGLDERKWMVQTINYANTSGVDWCVLTNGNEYRFYKVHAQVEVQEKLFLSVVLDDDAPIPAKVRSLSLIGRERMGQRAIDELWTEWRVDRQVRQVLEGLPTDEAFLRLIAKKSGGLSMGDVRNSLRRAHLRVDCPGVCDVIEQPHRTANGAAGEPMPAFAAQEVAHAAAEIEVEDAPAEAVGAAPRRKRRLMRTTEMIERGLLRAGMRLTIKGRPGSEAVVVDGRHVEFGGERMSFNDWGCRVTGWTAIQIYEWAEMPDGRLLSALREA